jgi:hypothetical protein
MNCEQAKVFLGNGDNLVLGLNDALNIRFILWSDDYDPGNPEELETRFAQMIHSYPDYTVKRDDGTGLECLRRSRAEKKLDKS